MDIGFIINIIEFVVAIGFFCGFVFKIFKKFDLYGVFWLAIFLWILYELSKIKVGFGLDCADIFSIAIFVMFLVYFAKTIYESDISIRETDYLLKKVYNKQAEENIALTNDEKKQIKSKYFWDLAKIPFNVIFIFVIGAIICYLVLSEINIINFMLIAMTITFVFAIIFIVKKTMDGLKNNAIEEKNKIKKDLPIIIFYTICLFFLLLGSIALLVLTFVLR